MINYKLQLVTPSDVVSHLNAAAFMLVDLVIQPYLFIINDLSVFPITENLPTNRQKQ